MVFVSKPARSGFRCVDAVVALDFQPNFCEIERLAAAAGSVIKIWSISPREEGATRCVAILTEHTPAYLVGLRWSPSGSLLGSCDARRIILWEFVKHCAVLDPDSGDSTVECCYGSPPLELWRPISKTTLPDEGGKDVFDLCWLDDTQILIGSHDCVRLWDVVNKRFTHTFEGPKGFVKGICANSIGDQFAAVGEDNILHIWKAAAPAPTLLSDSLNSDLEQRPRHCSYKVVCTDSESFIKAPGASLPYYRRGSFDPLGAMAAFPLGQRGNQCFGVLYHKLNSISDENTSNNYPPFRFRGHMTRICCVAFSKALFKNNETNKTFTLYAQASADGALSFWKVTYGDPPIGECLFLLKPRFLDEQASVVDMSWTSSGRTLGVGGDDGTLNYITITEDDIAGVPIITEKDGIVKKWPMAYHPGEPLRILNNTTTEKILVLEPKRKKG